MMSSLNTTTPPYHTKILEKLTEKEENEPSEMHRPHSSTSPFSKKENELADGLPGEPDDEISLPNYVGVSGKDDIWNGAGEPKKAAGDVSLSGKALVPFLKKAATRLPEVKGAGVQLRLRHLSQAIEENQLSDILIKKLNHIVDALDRENYQDAWEHFEGFKNNHPVEAASNWASGIKLLICELMPRQRRSRGNSAGPSPKR